MELTPVIKESFTQYAGAVLQSRALVDARDGLKPSARQIFWTMYEENIVAPKKHRKTANAVGQAMAKYYIHGNSSAEGIIMRAGQPFSMRYPLVDIGGNGGTLIESGNWAAPRYTESRLSELGAYLFADIKKDTIADWRDNYDNTLKYPGVLTSKGFYNIVNGSTGIGIGMACSIPQYNIKEINEALIKLLWNPDIDFEEIYCVPDFATGGILLNSADVKESHKNGKGSACKLRSVVEWDQNDRCFVVTEIPYGVYTNTICAQIEEIANGEDNPGIEGLKDLTGTSPLIKIYLSRQANPEKVLKYLYKNTSLQYHYVINFTVLENGRYPKVFTWKQLLQSHLDHEVEVYTRGFMYDLNKIKARLHIVDGLLKAISIIDEVITTIKGAADSANAKRGLMQNFGFTEAQAKAILDIKLSKLAHMEISSLKKEKLELEMEKERIEDILGDEKLFKQEIEKGFKEVSRKFGDERRTKVINLATMGDEEEIEQRGIIVNLTNYGNLYTSETSTLMMQRRNTVSNKHKMADGEHIIAAVQGSNYDTLIMFSTKGRAYNISLSEVAVDAKQHISSLIDMSEGEAITNMIIADKKNDKQHIVFVTKNGVIKKSLIEEYKTNRRAGLQAIKLKENDSVCSVLFVNNEQIAILTSGGNLVRIETSNFACLGKAAGGVKGISIGVNEYVVCAIVIEPTTKELVSIAENGLIVRVPITEFIVTGRGTKGSKIQKVIDTKMAGLVGITDQNEVTIVTSTGLAKIGITSFQITQKGAIGVHAVKLKENKVLGLF